MDKTQYKPGVGLSTDPTGEKMEKDGQRKSKNHDKFSSARDKREGYRNKYGLSSKYRSGSQEIPNPWEILPQKHSQFY
jgi:hypothetical protein